MNIETLAARIRELEQQLLEPEVRSDRSRAAPLLAEDFVEFGSTGRVYDKGSVLDALAGDTSTSPEVRNFEVKPIGTNVVLATYRTVRLGVAGQVTKQSLRASIWRMSGAQWQLVFHQGTPVQNET